MAKKELSVADAVLVEVNRLGATGVTRALLLRLAETVDERGTASAAAELVQLLDAAQAAQKVAAEDGIEAIRAKLPNVIQLHQRAAGSQSSSGEKRLKGRRNA